MSKPIALDFDGVLIDHPSGIDFDEIMTYGPMKDGPKVLNYLVDNGFEFYVLTARPKYYHKRIKHWLLRHGYPPMRVTNRKGVARLYVDDRAVRFTNWTDISKLLL